MTDHTYQLSNPIIPLINLVLLSVSPYIEKVNANLDMICHIAGILTFVFYAIMNAEKVWYRGRRLFDKNLRTKPLVEEKE